MFKFFRKYQKTIIIVGLPILLVIFLIPGAIQGIGQYMAQSGRTLGSFVTITGETHTIRQIEMSEAQQEMRVIEQGLGRGVLGRVFLSYGRGPEDFVAVNRPAHWILLKHEAQELGLIGGADDAERAASLLGNVLAQSDPENVPTAEQVISTLASNANVHPSLVVRTLTNLWGVRRLILLYETAGQLSEPRLERAASDLLHGIDARTLVIPAQTDGAADLPDPTEAELQSQLELYADFAPGEGPMGFGYALPDRVKLEWLEIDRELVRDSIASSDRLSGLELRKHFLRNKQKFLPDNVTDPDAVTFEEVESRVREDLLTQLTAELLNNIASFIEGEFLRVTRDLEREGLYLKLPEDWQERQLAFDALATTIQEQYNIGLPVYERRGDEWLQISDLNRLPGIGLATTSRFGGTHRLSDMIRVMKELGGDPSDQIILQEDVAGPVLRGNNGSVYAFRVFEAQESHPPESVDDVRPRLVADFKRLAAYERLVDQVENIKRQAETQGLQAVADAFDSFPQMQRNIGTAPEGSTLATFYNTTFMPPVGRDAQAIEEITEYASDLIERMLEEGRSFDDLSIAERTFVVNVPDKLALLVVQLADLRPAVRDDLALFGALIGEMVNSRERGENPVGVFSESNMFARHQVQLTNAQDDDDVLPEDEDGSATPDDSAAGDAASSNAAPTE